ncbi:LuxR C-terminal-related transcriptional regulator [Deinococcus koreensis]|nr:LuxR C-terminal-related transcriptional regulator [Deinococcus koreensis]
MTGLTFGGPLSGWPQPLLGRDAELKQLQSALLRPDLRLLTLLGPGGVGKTRLALALAERCGTSFADGAEVVDLAPVQEVAQVAPVIARTLGVPSGPRSAAEALAAELRDRQLLLVLDNFEHLLGAAGTLAELLFAARGITALVTSRAPLRLGGEFEYPVSPLPLPARNRAEELRASSAVQLFLARAARVRPEFAPGDVELEQIGQIVRRLDGLPLAIELAAGHLRLLPVRAILTRLGQRLDLGGPARDRPVRQQTLRATLDWSLGLLPDEAQALFTRLGVFVGGFTLETAEAVLGQPDALPGLSVLAEHSLIQPMSTEPPSRETVASEPEPRFTMLETVREFALEALEARGEAPAARRAHALSLLALAEASVPGQRGPQQLTWFARLTQEQPNMLAALRFCLDQGRLDTFAALVRALSFAWMVRVDYAALPLLEEALTSGDLSGPDRVEVLNARSALHFRQGRLTEAQAGEALAQLDPAVPTLPRGAALFYRGVARAGRDPAAAIQDLAEVARMADVLGDAWSGAQARQVEAWLRLILCDHGGAAERCAEVRAGADAQHDLTLLAWNDLCRAALALGRGPWEDAAPLLGAALEHAQANRDATLLTGALEGFAALAARHGEGNRAAALLGAVDALRREAGVSGTVEHAALRPLAEAGVTGLSAPEREAAARRGADLTAEEASVLARGGAPLDARPAPVAGHDLTPREGDVLRALSRGLSNKEIARELSISLYTVNDHVKTIYSKLGVSSRAAATRSALEQAPP